MKVDLPKLKHLLRLVETGTAEEHDFENMPKDPLMETQEFGYNNTEISSWKAYNGSMDAMKALAKAITPGRGWRKDDEIIKGGYMTVSTFWSTDPGNTKSGQICRYSNGNDARAWLVASMKAVIFNAERGLT